MLRLIGRAFSDEVSKIRNGTKDVFSADAVASRAKSAAKSIPWVNGTYVLPTIFAPSAKKSDFRVGPVRIVNKGKFLAENEEVLQREKAGQEAKWQMNFVEQWEAYIQRYDHFLTVDVTNCEQEMGWAAALETAEFALNLVRMTFTYQHTRNIKLGGGFLWEDKTANLIIDRDNNAWLSTRSGPWGSHLDDTWIDDVDHFQGGFSGIWMSYARVLASGASTARPVLERQQYAHQLIAEAYSEPHDHVRLVRLIAALEALAVLDGNNIRKTLALRCAFAGGWSDTNHADKIYRAVDHAYHVRSKIVHGVGATHEAIRTAFYELEQYLMDIVQGFSALYVAISKAVNPQSIAALRKEIDSRLSTFFWSPDLAISDSYGFKLNCS